MGIKSWTDQPKVRCATCPDHTKELAIFIPQNIEKTKFGLRYKCNDTARFCSWTCAAYHIQYFLQNDSRFKLLLCNLYEKFENKTISEIPSSIDPWNITEFGGNITLERFHKINYSNFYKFQNSFDDQDHNEVT